MAIKADEYFKKANPTKEVTLPSGSVFLLRRIQSRELLEMNMPFSSKEDLSGLSKEKQELVWKKMDTKQKKEQVVFCEFMVVLSVVEPKITQENIKNIPDTDYTSLLDQITDFSFGRVKKISPLSETT